MTISVGKYEFYEISGIDDAKAAELETSGCSFVYALLKPSNAEAEVVEFGSCASLSDLNLLMEERAHGHLLAILPAVEDEILSVLGSLESEFGTGEN